LDDRCYDPGGICREVYDHTQPATGFDMLAIEALAARDGIKRVCIGASDRADDHVDVVEKPRPAAGQMETGARVEHDQPPIGISGLGMLKIHCRTVRPQGDGFSRRPGRQSALPLHKTLLSRRRRRGTTCSLNPPAPVLVAALSDSAVRRA
jgi:hypothetical protein